VSCDGDDCGLGMGRLWVSGVWACKAGARDADATRDLGGIHTR